MEEIIGRGIGGDFYRTIIQTTMDGFWLVDDHGCLLDVNDAYIAMSGYTRDELLTMEIARLESKETATETAKHIQKVIENGSDLFESVHRKKDGKDLFVEISTTFFADEKKFVAFIRDITDRKRAEIEERNRTEFLDKIIESSALSLWISDEWGTAIRANQACLEFFGANEDEVIGKYNLFKDDELIKKGFMPVIRRVFTEGKVAEIEIDYDLKAVEHVQVKAATHKIIRSTFTPVLDSNGEVSNVIVQAVDLTDITNTKNALKETARELNERVKKLNCLYGISNIFEKEEITLPEILQATVNLIPPAWRYPEITCARIIFQQREYGTENFVKTPWVLSKEIVVSGEPIGLIEVYHLARNQKMDHRSFIKEEGYLINAIAERLGYIVQRKQAEEEKEALIRELQKALAEIKTLSGFLPICANCKKIRDDKGYWQQIEQYISAHSEAKFSHSICQECAKILYPELFNEDGNDKM